MAEPEHLSQSEPLPPKVQEALSILADLCGGPRYCRLIERGNASVVAEAFSSDAEGPFRVEISFDGRISRAKS